MAQRPTAPPPDVHPEPPLPPLPPLWPPFRLRCREATGLILAAQDRPATVGERVRVRLHLLACGACSRFNQQLDLMNRAMGRWRRYTDSGDDTPPPGR
ncbi:MAG: hypothetical protein RLZZ584_252 [Pseudomonadota bacterium]|jgi:hypothetical protein